MPRRKPNANTMDEARNQIRITFGFDDNAEHWKVIYTWLKDAARGHLPAATAMNAFVGYLRDKIESGEVDPKDILVTKKTSKK